MLSCNNKGGFFGSRNTPRNKRIGLFYGICVPLRITFGLLVWFLAQKSEQWNTAIAAIMLIISLASLPVLIPCLNDTSVWWNRKLHLFTMLVTLILSLLALGGHLEAKWIAVALWLDVAWGVYDSIFHFSK